MRFSPRPRRLALLLIAASALWVTGCAAWRIGTSAELARLSEPLQQQPQRPALRLLIVGDSTAVGTGASDSRHSLAGLIGLKFPALQIENRARDGARFADVASQLAGNDRFDMVLVQAGGNDVIRLRGQEALRADIEQVTRLARSQGDVVVLMPAGNVGNAPFFFAPLSWWMTSRSRQLHRHVREAAERHGALYVDLFHERADDPFVTQPGLHARDGLHPSDAGYQVWFDALLAQADLQRHLASAKAP